MPTESTILGMKFPQLRELIRSTIDDINKINSSIATAEAYLQKIEKTEGRVNGEVDENGEVGLLKSIQSAQKEASDKLQEIQDAYGTIVGYEDDEEKSIKDELEALIETFNESNGRITAFEKSLFGSEAKNEAGETVKTKGLKTQIEEFFSASKKKNEEIMKEIEERLSPGATSVELAETFKEKAKEYHTAVLLWNAFFIIVIGAFVIYFGILAFKETAATTFTQVWIQHLHRAPFIVFAMWLVMFGSNRRAENKKLEEAYRHKEAMAKTYTGFRKVVEVADEDTELLKKHIGNLLDAVNVNPGKFLSSMGDQHPFLALMSGTFSKRTSDNDE